MNCQSGDLQCPIFEERRHGFHASKSSQIANFLCVLLLTITHQAVAFASLTCSANLNTAGMAGIIASVLGLALAVATAGMATTATTTTKKTRRGAQRVGWLLREATIPVSSPHGGNSSSRTRPGMAPPRRATRGGWESREFGRCLPTAGNGRRLASLPAVFETWSVLCQKTKAVSPW